MGFAYSSCYVVPAAATKDRIGLLVTGAAPASTIRLGIYSDNGDMRPGALLLDAGPIDSTSTGLKQITIAQALAAGIYWLVALPLGASPTFQALYSDNASNAGSVIPLPGPATQLQSAAPFGGYVDNGSNVALPNPFPLPTYFQAGPMIVLRDV